MLNKEKYAKELEDILMIGEAFAFDAKRNEICTCQNISCSICKFFVGEGCAENRKEWLNSEYVDPVDWSKVPIDTPILVRDNGWHNLKEQKPEDRQEVLTWDGLGVHEDRWSDDADYFESTDAKEIWWREMPEPPEV